MEGFVNLQVPSEEKALIFNIQRFSIHDGPGIRTTVFFKGCPLRCLWCSNPESQNFYPEIMVRSKLCIKLNKCVEVCPVGAIKINDAIKIDRDKCTLCMECVKVCSAHALEVSGVYMTVDEVFKEVEKDRLFYINSGGGVTASGGEPLLQWKFVYRLFEKCKKEGISTALDTCGYAQWNVLEKVLEVTDLVLYDVKHLDSKTHMEQTGVSNDLILENLRLTVKKTKTWIRVPIIPGFNDSREHTRKIGELASKLHVDKVSLLPYHEYGVQKYEMLGRSYPLRNMPKLNGEYVKELKELIELFGVKVDIGK